MPREAQPSQRSSQIEAAVTDRDVFTTVEMKCDGGTLTFSVNDAGDYMHGDVRWEPSDEAWSAIREAVAP